MVGVALTVSAQGHPRRPAPRFDEDEAGTATIGTGVDVNVSQLERAAADLREALR